MSQENVEFVKALLSGMPGMDKQAILDALPEFITQACDPEIEWIEDPRRADRRTYHGHQGVQESFETWFDNFDEYRGEVERVLDCDDKVLVVIREEGRGKLSGATVSQSNYCVLSFRDGKIARFQEFYEERDALEAAGLSE
jgi:ketosteroid isomerase-like protein